MFFISSSIVFLMLVLKKNCNAPVWEDATETAGVGTSAFPGRFFRLNGNNPELQWFLASAGVRKTICHRRPGGRSGLSRQGLPTTERCVWGGGRWGFRWAPHCTRGGGRGPRASGEELGPCVHSRVDPPECRIHEFKADPFRLRETNGGRERAVRGIGVCDQVCTLLLESQEKKTETTFENVYWGMFS